ncbi:MAG TPA: patatin-like phospholipase family protein [Candidatus Avelusimicrobium excrementipullorum]|nr:patatin-like phospholipase family protein [Candidatus Avelusimicrobium excrementipullorum]
MKKIHALALFMLAAAFALPAYALPRVTQDAILRDFLWEEFISLPAQERPKVGLALSAGGVRGFAHVGVLEVLHNAGVPIDAMAGTSMGAVVGSLYAAGLPTDKLWEISQHIQMDTITPDFNLMGLLKLLFLQKLPSSRNLQDFFNQQIGHMRFEDMVIPFATAAMDVKTGEQVVFDSGPVDIAVRASMNLPGVFDPVPYRHRYLVDGAVVNYLPVDLVKQKGADYIIASVTPPDFFSQAPQTVAAYLLRIGDVRGAAMIEESAQRANFVIQNRVLDIGTLELDKLHEAGEVGIRSANDELEALQEDLILFAIDDVVQK